MRVMVNGREETLAEGLPLTEYLQSKEFQPEAYVFVLNDMVLAREELVEIVLREDDRLEILLFMGGG